MEIFDWLKEFCASRFCFARTYKVVAASYPLTNRKRFHHGFIYTLEGCESYRFADGTVKASPGTVLYIPKGESYTIELCGEVSSVITMEFELADTPDARPFIVEEHRGDDLIRCFTEAERYCGVNSPSSAAMGMSELYRAVYLMLKRQDELSRRVPQGRLRSAIEYMNAEYLSREFSISRMQELSGVSAKYFETLFKREYGVSAREWVLSMKLALAKELLKNEKLKIGEIALLVGYNDVYHFSKIFKAKLGITPSEYRCH